MGRRALRKINPQLDLSGFLATLEDMAPPFQPAEVFGRSAPLEIEVGSGKGLFLQNACAGVPAHNFLGVEIAPKYAAYCAARLARHGLTNGKVICGDAQRLFRDYLPAGCVAAVHVYFPDPWWKKRHHKRRVMNLSFIEQVERVLQIDGELHFWTDVEEYFAATLALLATRSGLAGPIAVAEREAAHDLDYRTHFERRCRREELPVFRSVFRRVG